MPTSCYVILFLTLANAFSISLSDAKARNEINSDHAAEISLRVALPSMASLVNINCNSGERFTMGPGQTHQWLAVINMVESCHAQWGHSEATFNAFDAQSDTDHVIIHWLVKPDGLYHSWDYFNWEKRASWLH